MIRLLPAFGIVLILGGLGHTAGVIRFYLIHGVPDTNRVLLDIWIGEAQLIGGSLYLAAFHALQSRKAWQTLAIFGAITIIGYAAAFIPVVVSRAPTMFWIPPIIYLIASTFVLTCAARWAPPAISN